MPEGPQVLGGIQSTHYNILPLFPSRYSLSHRQFRPFLYDPRSVVAQDRLERFGRLSWPGGLGRDCNHKWIIAL